MSSDISKIILFSAIGTSGNAGIMISGNSNNNTFLN